MFTGIIEEQGCIRAIRKGSHSMELTIGAQVVLGDTVVGDSIAVNGICLTVTSLGDKAFTADVMHETYNRATLAGLRKGDPVNLERAMRADGRLGGHIVSGHIDGMGKIIDIKRDDNAVWYNIETEPQIAAYIVEKGSITIDGISLTVASVANNGFAVSIIPHTQQATTLRYRKKGDIVNLENDCIGKYVAKFLSNGILQHQGTVQNKGITKDFLLRNGF